MVACFFLTGRYLHLPTFSLQKNAVVSVAQTTLQSSTTEATAETTSTALASLMPEAATMTTTPETQTSASTKTTTAISPEAMENVVVSSDETSTASSLHSDNNPTTEAPSSSTIDWHTDHTIPSSELSVTQEDVNGAGVEQPTDSGTATPNSNKYYPSFNKDLYPNGACPSDGKEPEPYALNPEYFLFDTEEECCKTYFVDAPSCMGSAITEFSDTEQNETTTSTAIAQSTSIATTTTTEVGLWQLLFNLMQFLLIFCSSAYTRRLPLLHHQKPQPQHLRLRLLHHW